MSEKPNDSPTSHDQNFKNLILDYPRLALELFSPEEAIHLGRDVTITPIRQEQLKQRLGDRFRELDVPLLVEWPDGRKEALLFALEEETDPRRFDVLRLVHYCADLAGLYQTRRVVPVVIYLQSSSTISDGIQIGGDSVTYLNFHYIQCVLPDLNAVDYWASNNIVARLCLSLMRWSQQQKLEVYGRATRGLIELESDPAKQVKYLDFIDIYSTLDDNDMEEFRRRYPQENTEMTTLTERLRTEGLEKGFEKGRHSGIEGMLRKQIARKFGELPDWADERLQSATDAQLEVWVDHILDAESLEELLGRR